TWASPLMGLADLLAVCGGTLTAYLLRFGKEATEQGLYGFSAALVGVALVLFRGHGPFVWMAVIAGSALAAALQHVFIKRKIPVFTLPFVLVTWVLLLLLPVPAEAASNPLPTVPGGLFVAAMVRGFGQVIFQSDLIAGLLFLVAVAVHSRIAALFGIAGAVLAALIAFGSAVPETTVEMGLWSYNAVLCAIAFAGTKLRNLVLFLISVPLAVLIGLAWRDEFLPQLTFPFVAAACISLLLEYVVNKLIKGKDLSSGGGRPAL
ncbi:MAG: urea transporter, partial [Flavobacteriales bacterium]